MAFIIETVIFAGNNILHSYKCYYLIIKTSQFKTHFSAEMVNIQHLQVLYCRPSRFRVITHACELTLVILMCCVNTLYNMNSCHRSHSHLLECYSTVLIVSNLSALVGSFLDQCHQPPELLPIDLIIYLSL